MYDTVINVIEKTLTDLALKYPEIKELIIIATEPKDAEGRSEDIIYFNTSNTLTREERRLAKELMREQMVLTNFLSERNVGPNMKRSSAAIELPKVMRNVPAVPVRNIKNAMGNKCKLFVCMYSWVFL